MLSPEEGGLEAGLADLRAARDNLKAAKIANAQAVAYHHAARALLTDAYGAWSARIIVAWGRITARLFQAGGRR